MLVSVIIPYYNKINHINNSLRSIINQKIKNIEIIIIYDDSNLKDLIKIKKKFCNFSNIKILTNDKNYGVAYSRNKGLKKANGKYCAFLDADDEWKPLKLIKQINIMEKNNLEFTFTAYEKVYHNKKIIVKCKKKKVYYEDLLRDCSIGLSTVVLKKKIIPNNLFTLTKTQEDLGAWLKLTKLGIHAHYIDENLTTWQSTSNSLSKNFYQKMKDLFYLLNKQEKFNLIKSIYYFLRISLSSVSRKV